MGRSKKRDLKELIDVFYDYLSKHDEIYLSSFRNIEDPEKRIYYPTNKRIFEIIEAIQDRPYIYVKKPNEKNTLLKLSSHNRDPKTRYVQIDDVMRHMEERSEHLKNMVKKADPSEYKIWIQQYQNLIQNSLIEMKRLRDRDKEFVTK